MILGRLEVENIASLKGKHSVDFQHSLYHENLFAITGPTGSGKSSLLSSISLALYGSHYKDKLSPIELVTMGCQMGSSTLYFSYNGIEYKARWEGTLKKANGEDLKQPKIMRSLFVMKDGDYVPAEKKIDEIIKLNFEQFCKTIILNQGEFSRFLTSDFKERKEILENLTEDHQLVAMGELLNKDIRELDQNISLKQSEIKGIESMSSEELMETKVLQTTEQAKLEKFKTEFVRITNNLKLYQDLLNALKGRLDNFDRKKSLEASLAEKHSSFNEFKAQFEKIQMLAQQNEAILRQKEPELIKADNAQKKIAYIKNQIEIHQKNLKTKQERHLTLMGQESKWQQELKDIHQRKILLDQHPHKEYITGPLFSKLEQRHEQYKLLVQEERIEQEKIIHLEKEQKELRSSWTKLGETLTSLQSSLGALEKAQKELTTSVSLGDMDYAQALQKSKTDELTLKQFMRELSSKADERHAHEKELSDLHKKANLVMLDLHAGEEKQKVLEGKLKFYEIAAQVNACQELSLQQENNCVVCGQHFDKLPPNPYLEKALQEDFEADKNKLLKLTEKIEGLKQDKNKLNLSITHTEEQIKKLKIWELEELKKYQVANAVDMKAIIAKTEERLKKLEASSDKHREYHEKILLIKQEKGQVEKLASENKTKTDATNESLKNFTTKMQSRRETILTTIKAMEEVVGFSFDAQKMEDYIQRCRDFDKIQREIKHIDSNLSNLNQEKIAIQVEIKDNQAEMEKKQLEIQAEKNLIQEITQGQDPEKVLKTLKENATKSASDLKTWQEKEKVHQGEIKEFESRLKMTLEQIEDLTNQSKKLAKNFAEDSMELKKAEPSYFAVNSTYDLFIQMVGAKFRLDQSVEDYDYQSLTMFMEQAHTSHQQFNDYLKNLEHECIVRKTKLELYMKNEDRMKGLSQEIAVLKVKLERKKNLYQVMGKDEFRTFLLSMIERQLLILANNELKSLCNERYELVQGSRKNNLTPEFYVIDRYNGGLKRNIFTLSGGETFMISLALALGLAEMTRGQAEINCFFIDEGFGTLDQDAIEEVLQVLLNMRAQGKQIGIISHIKALTDRIPVNIRLTKNANGMSKLDYLYN